MFSGLTLWYSKHKVVCSYLERSSPPTPSFPQCSVVPCVGLRPRELFPVDFSMSIGVSLVQLMFEQSCWWDFYGLVKLFFFFLFYRMPSFWVWLTSEGCLLFSHQGCNPLAQTGRSKLQNQRAALNQQILKAVRMRTGAENLLKWVPLALLRTCLFDGHTAGILLFSFEIPSHLGASRQVLFLPKSLSC